MYFYLLDENTGTKFVFSHITKNGGTTIRGCYNNNCSHLFTQLDRADEIKPEWEYVFSFAIHRDPYTRFLSAFSDFKDNRHHKLTLNGTVNMLKHFNYDKARNNLSSLEHHLIQQTDDIWGIDNIQYLLSQENLKDDLKALLQKYNITNSEIDSIENRKSKSKSYQSQLSASNIKILNWFYKQDFERFGYKQKVNPSGSTNSIITIVGLVVTGVLSAFVYQKKMDIKVFYALIVSMIIMLKLLIINRKEKPFFNEEGVMIDKYQLFSHINPQLFVKQFPTRALVMTNDQYKTMKADHFYRFFKMTFHRDDRYIKEFLNKRDLRVFDKFSNQSVNITNMILFLRRHRDDPDATSVFEYFRNYIQTHMHYVTRFIDARHLLSINKTFLEFGTEQEKKNALVLNTIGVEYKLMHTFEYNIGKNHSNETADGPLQPFYFHLHEDTFKNEYLGVLKKNLEETPILFMLWKAFMRWMVVYDKTFFNKVLLTKHATGKTYAKEMTEMIFS